MYVWVCEVAKRKLTILKLELTGNCEPPSSSGRNQTWILWKNNKLSEALSYPSSPVFKGFYLYYMCRSLKAPGIGHQACAARAVTPHWAGWLTQHRFQYWHTSTWEASLVHWSLIAVAHLVCCLPTLGTEMSGLFKCPCVSLSWRNRCQYSGSKALQVFRL